LPHLRASVLLLTYNQEGFVKEAMQSLIAQDVVDLEIVVSDDQSSDSTWEVVKLVN
jgi:glycosyltransferase involved in cell wall biosynthesis